MSNYTLVTVGSVQDLEEHGLFCVKTPMHRGRVAKSAWLERRFADGLRLELVHTADGEKAGFVEYVPGEHTWRTIEAPGWLVIHCLWVASRKFPYEGMGAALLEACVDDARAQGKAGVAVVSSDGPWMARRDVFLDNGFELADEAEPSFQLLVRRLDGAPPPRFPRDWDERLKAFPELTLVYTDQCPFIGKAVEELPPVAEEHGTELRLVELDDPAEARRVMPSPYGVVALLHGGRLLADHPVSATRFRSILQKELGLRPRR